MTYKERKEIIAINRRAGSDLTDEQIVALYEQFQQEDKWDRDEAWLSEEELQKIHLAKKGK
ncbi:MAG: hypothetical protein JKY70_06470 [Mucilaginibacter sp.]|nr:hypothetical protein [Mucilaginibacter sp.]